MNSDYGIADGSIVRIRRDDVGIVPYEIAVCRGQIPSDARLRRVMYSFGI